MSDNLVFVPAGQLTNCELELLCVLHYLEEKRMTGVQLTIKAFGPGRESRGQSSPYY